METSIIILNPSPYGLTQLTIVIHHLAPDRWKVTSMTGVRTVTDSQLVQDVLSWVNSKELIDAALDAEVAALDPRITAALVARELSK